MKPFNPTLLPLKKLDGVSLLASVGAAREALARFDESLLRLKSPMELFEPIAWMESISSLRSQEAKVELEEVLLFAATRAGDAQKVPLLTNICLAKEALSFAQGWKKGFNASFFCALHQIVKRDQPNAGRLRQDQGWIGPEGETIEKAYYLPPSPDRVPSLMQNLSRYLIRKNEEPLVQLAIAFAQLLIIHPFLDGNGRVARMLIPVFLWKKGILSHPLLFISRYFKENRLVYYRKLYDISESRSWEEWILFFLKGLREQALSYCCCSN